MARTPTNTAAPQASNLNSLANGAAKSIGKINFNSNNAHLATLKLKVTLASSGLDANGTLELYFLGSQDDIDWTDGIDPTSTSDESSNIVDAIHIGSLHAATASRVVNQTIDLFSRAGNGYAYGAVVVLNSSGAALPASGHDADYQTIVFS